MRTSRSSVVFLTAAALLGFAGNSLLCRFALGRGEIAASAFTLVRLLSGALTLSLLLSLRRKFHWSAPSWPAAFALFIYALFFSLAYRRIDAGTGALILFGVVQLTMIGWNAYRAVRLTTAEAIGLLLALAGLAVLSLPGKAAPSFVGAVSMAIAGAAWGVYSGLGKTSADPTLSTARKFVGASLLALPLIFFLCSGTTTHGWLFAFLSGAVTSGLGYSFWYAALPHLTKNRAAIIQLSVPIVTAFCAIFWLGETASFRLLFSSVLVLGGVALAFLKR